MPTLILSIICLTVAFSLALINEVTGPIIEEAQNQATNAALAEVLPDGKNFEEITLGEKYPTVITKGYKADGGFVFRATVSGKSSGLIIMIGIDPEGKVVGTQVIAEQETNDYDVKVFPLVTGTDGAYKDMTLDTFEPFISAGATLTSKAYADAVKAALQAFAIANGQDIDLRTPEEIIQDNCNLALGTEGIQFTRWFATEILEGIDAVYEAEDNSGKVFIVGESFIGVKSDGTILNAENVNPESIISANQTILESTLTNLDVIPAGVNKKTVKNISVTNSGNYVFELTAKGYETQFYNDPSTYINIKLSVSADGRIIDCLTVSHNESEGYGDACATEEYYEQYRGASASDIVISVEKPDKNLDQISLDNMDIGSIASATYTTYYYQSAVKAALQAFDLITASEGGSL